MVAGGAVLFFLYFPMYMAAVSISAEEKTVYLRRTFFNIVIGCLVVTLLVGVLAQAGRVEPVKIPTAQLQPELVIPSP
jgi:hypothetical protein